MGVDFDELEWEPLELEREEDKGTVGVVPNMLNNPPRLPGSGRGVGRGVMLVDMVCGFIVSVGLRISSRSVTVVRGLEL